MSDEQRPVVRFVAELSEAALADLVAALEPRLASQSPEPATRGWLDARRAAAHLGLPSVSQLHKLTSARAIPFSQERPGAKCYFRISDLDAYRERHLR